MISRALNIPEAAFQALGAVEAGAACSLHRELDSLDGMPGEQVASHHNFINGLSAGRILPHSRKHRLMGERCSQKRGFEFSNEVDYMVIRTALLRQSHSNIASRFGNPQIHRINEREGNGCDDLKHRMPFTGLALQYHRCFRHNMSLDDNVMGAGTAHAERSPIVHDFDVRGVHGYREMQDHRRFAFALQHGSSNEQFTGRGGRGEHLARSYLVASVHGLRNAGAGDPIGAATREQDEAFGGDALQQRLGSFEILMTPTPSGHRHLMSMHGEGKGRRTTIAGDGSQHLRQFIYFRPSAA